MSFEAPDGVLDTGVVTHECFCGETRFFIWATFEESEISSYSLEMYCFSCNTKYQTPTLAEED